MKHDRFAVARRLVVLLSWVPLAAFGLTLDPQPRVIQPMHNAPVTQIRATADGQRVISVAEDKSVRIWRAADLALLRSIPLPSEPGEEGAARAIAITQDGRRAFVAGWTGVDYSARGESRIYELDLEAGHLLRALPGPLGAVEALALSKDGTRLAIGSTHGGLRVLDARSGATLFDDREYAERVVSLDYNAQGKLVTAAYDGCMRIYGPDGKLTFRAQYPPPPAGSDGKACTGVKLGGVRFSPDGNTIALGLQERPELLLVDAQTERLDRIVRVDDPAQHGLCCMAWRADSQSLYVYGLTNAAAGADTTRVYRVDRAGPASSPPALAWRAPIKLRHSAMLPDGSLVLGTERPSLIRFDARFHVLAQSESVGPSYREDWRSFRVDRDGTRLSIERTADRKTALGFELANPPETAYATGANVDPSNLRPPRRDGRVAITATLGEASEQSPILANGQRVELKRYQQLWSWATHAERPVAALGTNWSVALVDGHGKLLWERTLPAPAYQVTITDNGRWVVAAIGDGTIRWLSLDDGNERLGLFLHTNGVDWLAWRPDGYYASSPQGDQYFGWLVNRGEAQTPDVHRAVQFERTLYQPGLVQAVFEPAGARSLAAARPLAETLKGFAAPRVQVTQARLASASASSASLQLDFAVEATGKPIREIGVYLDGVPVLTADQRRVGAAESGKLVRRLTLAVPQRFQSIRVEAETDQSLGLAETTTPNVVPALPPRRGALWVVAVGVRQAAGFKDCLQHKLCGGPGDMALPNAIGDAKAIAQSLAAQAGRAFDRVETVVLTDDGALTPDKQRILVALSALERARPEDTVLVFLASHGEISGADAGEYFFLPMDASRQDVARLVTRQPASGDAPFPSLLSSNELFAMLRRVPGRRILAIDTCRSAGADGRSNPYGLTKRSAAAQIAVLAAAAGNEQSYEDEDESPHGAFTKALIEAVDGRGDVDGDGRITLAETYQYVGRRVQGIVRRLNDKYKSQVTQTPTLTAVETLRGSVVAGR